MNKHVAYVYFLKNIKNQLLVKVYFDFMCPIKLKNGPGLANIYFFKCLFYLTV